MAVRSARLAGLTAICATLALPCAAQVTPAAGYTPPDNTPVIRIGAVIYTDYTVTEKPKGTDADGNEFTPNSFNVGRAYLNVTGNISHIVAFRITPDITRETGAGSSLNGSYTYRLKYAYAQFNLDDWMHARLLGPAGHAADAVDRLRRGHLQVSIPGDRIRGARGLHVVVRCWGDDRTTTSSTTTARSMVASTTAENYNRLRGQ